MRWLVATVLLGLGLSGCLDGQESPDPPEAITLVEARDLLHSVIGTEVMVTRAAMSHEFDVLLDGRSHTWLFETVAGGRSQAFEISAGGEVEGADPIPDVPTFGNAPQYSACQIAGDSPPIAMALAESHAWRVLDLASATTDPYADRLWLSWEAECVGDHTVWTVHSSLVQNQGGTWSARAFWLDQRGRMAGFFGDPARGHPGSVSSATPNGINVEYTWALEETGMQGGEPAEFETTNAVQIAIVADVAYQGIEHPLAEGTLVATGPSGEEYAAPWAQAGPRVLYIPEADPGDAQGKWTVHLDLGSELTSPFSTRFEICAGIVFKPTERACQALFDFQNSA